MAPSLSKIIIPALGRHTATVIFAHGLGDSGAGWQWLAENWRRNSLFEEVKFVFPDAPKIPITVNMRTLMPGWYDITKFTDLVASEITHDEPGILKSRSILYSLIDAEVSDGIPPNRIVLAGFSQGGAMSIFSGITYPQKLGGIVGLSCYLLLHHKLKDYLAECGNANDKTQIFMGHGSEDPLVKPEWGQLSAQKLKEMGFDVDLKMYTGLEHSACPKEIKDLENYLTKHIPSLGPCT
ncbi:hypothetical protein K3495_g385 [Podosphaera aphanis]|nr:hypothetical protein K3495_g385 [Podosphaera aphanis]